jgi:DNA/RNA-binding domain of Phe-tRNA-synthetase-like protein
MFIHDDEGVLSSVLYGPDFRTRITAQTSRLVFTVYAPAGIGAETIEAHIQELRRNVELVAPQAEIELMGIYTASGRSG